MIPFAVVGSERNVIIDGKSVRGRKNRWGVVNVEDETHCEFVYLRNFLTRCVSPSSECGRQRVLMRMRIGHTCRTSSRRRRRFTTRRSAQNSCSRSRSRRTRGHRRHSHPREGTLISPPCPRSDTRMMRLAPTGVEKLLIPLSLPRLACLVLFLNAPCLDCCCWTVPPRECLYWLRLAAATLV